MTNVLFRVVAVIFRFPQPTEKPVEASRVRPWVMGGSLDRGSGFCSKS